MVRKKQFGMLGRLLASSVALSVAIFPMLMSQAGAATVTNRSIFMQSSTASASTTYSVSFTLETAHTNFEGVVIEFCEESPILSSATCTIPTGLSVNSTPTYDNLKINGGSEITDWTADDLNTQRTFILYNTTGVSTSIDDVVTFDITSMTNPSTVNDTFYARIYTYDNSAGATGYTLANPDAGDPNIDEGGIALSTGNPIAITAKVQEQIDLCVYTGACGTSAINIALGDTDGVLSTESVYSDITAKFDISTNAASGAAIVLKGNTLTSGANNIDAIGDTKSRMDGAFVGTEQFGMCLWESTGSGLTLSNNTYNDSACNLVTTGADSTSTASLGFDSTSTGLATGDTLGTKAAGDESTATMAFAANIAVTTLPGIYTTTLQLIATGTY